MAFTRRRLLSAALAACAAPLFAQQAPGLLPASKGRRVVVVGGGWGGLAAARHLRALAPELEVVLLERNPSFFSLPLSNQWLAGLVDGKLLAHDCRAAALTFGYTFLQAEVTAIDRERRRVHTATGTLDYDWLVLAVGIRHDWAAWFGDDRRTIDEARTRFACAWTPGGELVALKARLDNFRRGDLVMTVPSPPFRCQLAPYERALVIAHLFKTRAVPARLTLLDPNPPPQRFAEVFEAHYRDQIAVLPHARIRSVDPFAKTIATEFDDIRFDDALLMPPQQAGELAWQAGLIGHDKDGKPGGWAAQDPLRLHAAGDTRVFLVGDLIGPASPLFGHYPKSGHLAARLGRIAAREIAARARGSLPDATLPESSCFVMSALAPPESLRVDTRYRLRGDGLIVQATKQHADPNPRGEDADWAKGMFRELFG
ncbi:MAG: Sulfide dehydrogenase [flavocytochrome c] flavoprotein chain [Rhodocyclaceae bacterium]|nr:MAG: NAD(P)/FAD-dependent oxidoreductase [Rhodocyclaceae bacterium]MBE7422454.1 NAD(P)/FAD-dependent oxidoreductase [Zoogloeaceae bacterium]MBV6408100.1 Sulfide dehydrogenase [flavocytochrome c] flavoprotein chain [Rhodocyclaceae bacterium]MCK6382812.1 NAD(P)/FAD-dependent oxidoreductase [Rhodocyclaceae bacterium]CAG0933261.1 sulfide dehydrogenase [flavocytochrome c] flavoprotein chain [Rhodocyclaceae bacterium]